MKETIAQAGVTGLASIGNSLSGNDFLQDLSENIWV